MRADGNPIGMGIPLEYCPQEADIPEVMRSCL